MSVPHPKDHRYTFRGGKHLFVRKSVRDDDGWRVHEVDGDYDFSSDLLPEVGRSCKTFEEAVAYFNRRAEELGPRSEE